MRRHRWTPYHDRRGTRCTNCGLRRWFIGFIDKPRSVRYLWRKGMEKVLRESEPTPPCEPKR